MGEETGLVSGTGAEFAAGKGLVGSSGANSSSSLEQERLDRCIPIAKEILRMIVWKLDDINFGDGEAVRKSMTPIAEEVLALMLKENINWVDRFHIMQLAIQPVAFLDDVLKTAYDISWDKALTKLWGKEALDLKFKDVHDKLVGGGPTQAE